MSWTESASPPDSELAERVRALLLFEPDLVERRMFGGLAFLVDRHIAVAVSSRGGLLMRADQEDHEALLARPHVEPFTMRGRPLRGWVHVGEQAVGSDDELRWWVQTGVELARALPPA
jgi:TfoX/Sxy family transcriptional regulator of competence genes